MNFDDLVKKLEDVVRGDLPGTAAQLRLAPQPRPGWDPGRIPDDGRPSAGLLLVYPRDEAAHVLLTVRRADLPDHAGQVSLPGGAVDPGETLEQCALREAEEEVGAAPAEIRLLGALTPLHIPVSNFNLHPFVGAAARRFDWRPQESEVARVLEVPVEHLLDPVVARREVRVFKGVEYDVPYLEIHGEKLWGATAMVVAEFLALLELA
jgi:8-oxo-dGTP pyrophosphatase MutT (NUDIX family)